MGGSRCQNYEASSYSCACTRNSITYHTPQQLHRLKREDWDQLREAGFLVDRVWEQGISLESGEEDLFFSSSLMNVRQQSQGSEVETQEEALQNLQVDHNLLLKPTLQAMCWLTDMILSLDGVLQVEMVTRPAFNLKAIDNTIQEMQFQLSELTEQRHQIELSMVAIFSSNVDRSCKTDRPIRITISYGCYPDSLYYGFWNRETIPSFRLAEVVNAILLVPIKTIWTWIPH